MANHLERTHMMKPDSKLLSTYAAPSNDFGSVLNAKEALKTSLYMVPSQPEVHFYLAVIALDQEDDPLAEHHLRETLRLDPSHKAASDKLEQLLASKPKTGG